MTDTFHAYNPSLDSPAENHFEITPSDTADLPFRPRALRIDTGGTIVMRDDAQQDVSYTVADGEILAFRPWRVLATGTTATGIVGWF